MGRSSRAQRGPCRSPRQDATGPRSAGGQAARLSGARPSGARYCAGSAVQCPTFGHIGDGFPDVHDRLLWQRGLEVVVDLAPLHRPTPLRQGETCDLFDKERVAVVAAHVASGEPLVNRRSLRPAGRVDLVACGQRVPQRCSVQQGGVTWKSRATHARTHAPTDGRTGRLTQRNGPAWLLRAQHGAAGRGLSRLDGPPRWMKSSGKRPDGLPGRDAARPVHSAKRLSSTSNVRLDETSSGVAHALDGQISG